MRRVPWNAGYGEKNKPAGNDALKHRIGRSDEETRHHVRWEKPLARAHDQAGRSALPLGATLRESARKLIPLWDALRSERSQTAQLCVRPTPLGRVWFVW